MKRFKSKNDLNMIDAGDLNWEVITQYRNNTGPEFYVMNVGDLSEQHQFLLDPRDYILSLTTSGQNETPHKFHVGTLAGANVIVKSFCKAMKIDITGTIYVK